MKFVSDQVAFSKALQTVAKAISGNSTLPVLENILLKAEGSVVTLTATNLEISISTYFEVSIEEEGAITLPAKILVSYVSLLPEDAPITVEVKENNVAVFTSGKATTRMKGISSEDFPIIPSVDAKHSFNIERTLFLDSLSKVVFSTSTNTTRPILSGVMFRVEAGKLVLASTDSFRLSEKVLEQPGLEVENPISLIVPAKTLMEVTRVFQKENDEGSYVHVHIGSNQIMFTSGETKLISRLIEGAYPNYAQIIPKEFKTEAVLNNEEVLKVLKRLNLFAKENNFHLKFEVKPETKELAIYTESLETGEDRQVVALEAASGDEVTIALNSTFVIDALGHLNTGTTHMSVVDSLKPAVFKRKVNDEVDSSYIHLIMPLKA